MTIAGFPRGGVLSDRSIHDAIRTGLVVVRPFVAAHVQPSSLDLTLGGDGPLELVRGRFVLASTAEWIELPPNIQGQVHGRSSVGRLGVLVHFTAGLIDPGFRGRITLECMALDKPQCFELGDRLAQITLHWLDRSAEHPYAGRYQDQEQTTPSRFVHERMEPNQP